MYDILNVFSLNLRKRISDSNINLMDFQEIRLRVGKPMVLIKNMKEYYIGENSIITGNCDKAFIINEKEIKETMEYISNYSMYAFEEEIRNGFITIEGGHRVGICGRAVIEGGKIKTIKNISFINIRIAHEVKNCSERVMKYIYEDSGRINNSLIISPPLYGKTTFLRDIIRNISDGWDGYIGQNVAVSDERSEIAASYLGKPQNDVGKRTDVMDGMPKKYGIMMLIRTMSPKVVAVDEIGTKEDIDSISYGINCGCRFVATIHGDSIEEINSKPFFSALLKEGIFKRFFVINKYDENRKVEIYNELFERIGDEIIG